MNWCTRHVMRYEGVQRPLWGRREYEHWSCKKCPKEVWKPVSFDEPQEENSERQNDTKNGTDQ